MNSAVDEANRVKDENVRLREDIRSLERKLASVSKGEQQQTWTAPQAHLGYDVCCYACCHRLAVLVSCGALFSDLCAATGVCHRALEEMREHVKKLTGSRIPFLYSEQVRCNLAEYGRWMLTKMPMCRRLLNCQ